MSSLLITSAALLYLILIAITIHQLNKKYKANNSGKSKIKYVLHPGWIRSRASGERHYISAGQLIHLYKVPHDECIVIGGQEITRHYLMNQFIHLYPDYEGNYRVPVWPLKGEN